MIGLAGRQTVLGELPLARLFTVFPPGGKVGTQFEVTISGADLDEATDLRFSDPGISARQKKGETNGVPIPNQFVVTIAAEVAPGIYEARVAGRFGISNPRAFVAGDLPEITAPTTNSTSVAACPVALNSVVNGRAEPNTFSFYKFTTKKGQRVLVECDAREIDSRMDAALILYDSTGKELDRSRNGGLLDSTVPADGEYRVKAYDFLFRGGGEYFYRLGVRTGPWIDFILPAAGLPGTKSKFVLYGRNLPGGKSASNLAIDGKALEQVEVEIEIPREAPTRQLSSTLKPAAATLDAFEYRLKTPEGVSNPVLVGLAAAPLIAEQQTNDQPAQAQSISPPCEMTGQFYPAGDRDWMRFEAAKGDRFWVEIFSRRLGLPTDPLILIQRVSKNDKGEEKVSEVKELYDTESNAGGVEYKTTPTDPAGRFEAEETGTYRILVRDLFNTTRSAPRLVYRLTLRKETPDFRLLAVAPAPPSPNKDAKEALVWTPLVRRGETIPIRVMCFRRENFDGDIELTVENLPAGVTCAPARIESGKTSATLLLTATESATAWGGPLRIVGKAKIGGADLARPALGATVNWTVTDYGNEAIQSRLTRDMVLAVSGVESAPISVEPAENKIWEGTSGTKLLIPIKIIRRGDFTAALKLKASGLGFLDKLKEIDVDGKATNATVEIDLGEHKIPAGTHSFFLQTQTPGKYRNNPEAAKTAEETLKQAEKLIAELNATIKAAPELKQTAIKAAMESAVKAKAASETLAGAAKAAAQADGESKTASEKLTAATEALEKKPGDPDLLAAKDAAVKAAEEAESKAKSALEARTTAEKAAEEAQTKARKAAEAQAVAEKTESETPAKLKEAEKAQELAAARAKETAKIAEPRDVTVTVYSAPIQVKITAPVTPAAK